MRNPERFWGRIAKSYDKHGEKKRAKLLETIEYIKPHLEPRDRILDFACGTSEKALAVAGRISASGVASGVPREAVSRHLFEGEHRCEA